MTVKIRDVQKMFQQIPEGAVVIQDRWGRISRLADLAYVAEHFGFDYGDTEQTGGRAPVTRMALYRSTDPAAQQRAAGTAQQFPTAGQEGAPLPGMRTAGKRKYAIAQGHEREHELLKARINFDLTGRSAEKRMLVGAVGITLGAAIVALRGGGTPTAFQYSGIFWAVLMAILAFGFWMTRKRNARFAARLREAGYGEVREGRRTRWLKGGQQLPGQVNPFAGGIPGQPSAQQQQPYGAGAPGAGSPGAGFAGPGPAGQPPYAGAGVPGVPGGPGGPGGPGAPVAPGGPGWQQPAPQPQQQPYGADPRRQPYGDLARTPGAPGGAPAPTGPAFPPDPRQPQGPADGPWQPAHTGGAAGGRAPDGTTPEPQPQPYRLPGTPAGTPAGTPYGPPGTPGAPGAPAPAPAAHDPYGPSQPAPTPGTAGHPGDGAPGSADPRQQAYGDLPPHAPGAQPAQQPGNPYAPARPRPDDGNPYRN